MKKIIFILAVAVSCLLLPLTNMQAASSITNRLKGRLLLQVERGGAIWYVNPIDSQKYSVTFANALSLFARFALGISDENLLKIPADLESIDEKLDTDGDGYKDRQELQNNHNPYKSSFGHDNGRFFLDYDLAQRLRGRFLLQVEQHGAVWYVDNNGIRHNVRWGNLMGLFRKLALGISDKDLAEVGETDNRILLTPQNISQYNNPPNCNEKFNSYSANTNFTYSSGDRGISVELPYNSSWGNDKYRINPYDEHNNKLDFGFIAPFEGCSWVRSYSMNFLPAKTANQVIQDFEQDQNYPDMFSVLPYKSIINNLEIVKYEMVGMCGYPALQVIGKKYNYEFQPMCSVDRDKDFEYLENIVKTVKFLDETTNWLPLKSNYFTLSFKIPSGFEFKEGQNYILVAKSPYYTRDIGDDNAFFRLTRYNEYETRESRLVLYRNLLKNIQESIIVIDNSSFLKIEGDDWGRFEGTGAGKVTVVLFDASWLEIIERPANSDQNFDPITIGNQILSTFKFSK
ncbi:MAG: thrombospondin type 3 repeat-containing protein [Patescibacteria group bacterium]